MKIAAAVPTKNGVIVKLSSRINQFPVAAAPIELTPITGRLVTLAEKLAAK